MKKYHIMKSLEFSCMGFRHSTIIEAHRQTFEWIFTAEPSSGEYLQQAAGFSDWLEYGNGIYWITGKPGKFD
jgi:hypothetical protein